MDDFFSSITKPQPQPLSNSNNPPVLQPNGQTEDAHVSAKLNKIPTVILGFDENAHGGIPEGRTTLISGTTGSGKTIFAMQFLINGIINYGEPGIFVTFEENPKDVLRNMLSFNWNIQEHLDNGKFAFVDASPSDDLTIQLGNFNLDAFFVRILAVIKKIQAKRLAIDSISALFQRYSNEAIIRRELYGITSKLKKEGITTIITGERTGEDITQIARFGVEEFVSDNVILLHNLIDDVRGERQRSIEILKFRGTTHETQNTPLIVGPTGIDVFPRPKPTLKGQKIFREKVSTGIKMLDQILSGGIPMGSSSLLIGPPGTGKSVILLQFIIEGAKRGEHGLFISFEESTDQIIRNAESFGWKLKSFIDSGMVKVVSSLPEEYRPEEHFKRIKDITAQTNVKRFALESLSTLERIYSPDKFREIVVGLNAHLKSLGITSILTSFTSTISSNDKLAKIDLSAVLDNVLLLKLINKDNQLKKGLVIIKCRGLGYNKYLHELTINSSGVDIGGSITNIKIQDDVKLNSNQSIIDNIISETSE